MAGVLKKSVGGAGPSRVVDLSGRLGTVHCVISKPEFASEVAPLPSRHARRSASDASLVLRLIEPRVVEGARLACKRFRLACDDAALLPGRCFLAFGCAIEGDGARLRP